MLTLLKISGYYCLCHTINMKINVAVVAFCAIFALSQAASVGKHSSDSCSEDKVKKYLDELLSDVFDLRAELINDFQTLYVGVLNCTKSSFVYFESCVQKTIKDNIKSFEHDAEKSWDKIEPTAEKLGKEIKKCLTFK